MLSVGAGNADQSGEKAHMGGTGKKSEPPRRTTANRRSRPRAGRGRRDEDGDIATPKRDRSGTTTTISRYRNLSLSISRDAFEIEQMRAPAVSRQFRRELRRGQQQHRGHRQRHGADPVQPHRRQFLAAAGIGPAAAQQTPAFPTRCRAACRRATRIRAAPASQDASARPRGLRGSARRRLARRYPKQQADQIDAGEIGAHRLDQPRIAIDQQRRGAIIGQDVIDRQRAVPGEPLADRGEMRAHDRPRSRFA